MTYVSHLGRRPDRRGELGAYKMGGVDFDDPQFASRPYDPWTAYAQSKTADILLAVGLGRAWAGSGVTANAPAPGWIHTNLQRHLSDDAMRAAGAMDADGNLVTPPHYKTPEQGAATSVLLAASPLLAGVTGRFFEDNQEVPVATDPDDADRLWALATEAVRNHRAGVRA